jgi:hypothetical protein
VRVGGSVGVQLAVVHVSRGPELGRRREASVFLQQHVDVVHARLSRRGRR